MNRLLPEAAGLSQVEGFERMKRKTLKGIFAGMSLMTFAALLTMAPQLKAQAAPPATRFVGTITAINGDTLTVKADSGEIRPVQVPASAILKQIEPGQKDLSAAQSIQLSTLATGDRVLVRIDPNGTGATPLAA